MRIALICSAHGFGHLTRQLELARHLRTAGTTPVLFTAAPRAMVDEWLPNSEWVQVAVDVGLVQSDSLTEDIDATRAALEQHCSEAAVDALSQLLLDHEIDRVVADTAPAALEAARRAGLPAVAVGNFTWPWIYAHYPSLHEWAERLTAWQSPHPAAQLRPGPDLTGFANVTRFGLVGRKSSSRDVPRWPPGHVLVSFGGFGLTDLEQRLPILDGVTWVLAPPMPRLERPDCRYVEGVPYPAMVAACDVVVTKPGYGIYAEAARARTKLVWVPRGRFPEAEFIIDAFRQRGDREVPLPPAATSRRWREALARALQARLADPPPPPAPPDEAARLASWLIQQRAVPAPTR